MTAYSKNAKCIHCHKPLPLDIHKFYIIHLMIGLKTESDVFGCCMECFKSVYKKNISKKFTHSDKFYKYAELSIAIFGLIFIVLTAIVVIMGEQP